MFIKNARLLAVAPVSVSSGLVRGKIEPVMKQGDTEEKTTLALKAFGQ